jgi:ribose 5-phosphate isomerase B
VVPMDRHQPRISRRYRRMADGAVRPGLHLSGGSSLDGAALCAYRARTIIPAGVSVTEETPVKIAIGSDHAGFDLKECIKAHILELKHEVLDVGTLNKNPVDYPKFAEKVALALLDGTAERGILVCGSGVGASVAANKIPGVRAGLCHDHYSAHQGVEHDDMNVLVVGGRIIGESVALELVSAFLDARYAREDRHQRRLKMVKEIERRYSGKDGRSLR